MGIQALYKTTNRQKHMSQKKKWGGLRGKVWRYLHCTMVPPNIRIFCMQFGVMGVQDFYFFVGFEGPLYLDPNRLVFCLFLVCS
jgi:hypothetical protein